jgi:redox-sensitive bicupin YhaK (pirin superfamily)
MKEIKSVYRAVPAHMGDLTTFRAMPTQKIQHLDPFLFLNHHGPQTYKPHNNGLPFGPHPHRGFETLTFIFDGDIVHWDSSGFKSVIHEGGVQWMTAGSGLIHSEQSSKEFTEKGGPLEIIQLWMNLPSSLKMTPPDYKGFEKDKLIHIERDDYTIHLISGTVEGITGPMDSPTNLTMMTVDIHEGGDFEIAIPEGHETLFYVVRGEVVVNGDGARKLDLVTFDRNDGIIRVHAEEESKLIIGHGLPFNEPIVAYGPFVMNSEQEIQQAFKDYEAGKLGTWN